MKVKTLALLAGAGGSLLIAGQADAGFTGLTFSVTEISSAGFDGAVNPTLSVIRVFGSFDGLDATDAVQAVAGTEFEALDWEILGGGVFYESTFSDPLNGPPSIAIAGAFASAAADTFMTIGEDRSNNLIGFTIDPGGSLVLTATTLSTTGDGWGVSGIANNSGLTSENGNDILLGQFTLDGGTGLMLRGGLVQVSSDGVSGDQFLISSIAGQDDGNNGGVGLFIPTIPGPGALALLGLAGLVGGRRRRRA